MSSESMSVFPTFIKDAAFQEPKEASYYLLAGNGTFLVKNMELYSSSVQFDAGLPGLLNHEAGVSLKFGKVPRPLICTILGFFRTALLWHAGEAIVFLYYCEKDRSFLAKAPPQRVYRRVSNYYETFTEPWVEYDTCDRPRGFIKLGTIHSHCDLRAFHSYVDTCDERYEDGLHITIGHILREPPDISVSFVVNGRRFKLRPEDVLGAHGQYVPMEPPACWMSQITCVVYGYGTTAERRLKYEPPTGNAAMRPIQAD